MTEIILLLRDRGKRYGKLLMHIFSPLSQVKTTLLHFLIRNVRVYFYGDGLN